MKNKNSPLIETKNLTKVYYRRNSEPVKALDGIDLKAYQGEFLTIVGRSGSGKTTLLNLMGALDRPTRGEIKFGDKSLSNFSNRNLAVLRREKFGFIFQTFNLLPSLTVFENVESALVHSGMSMNAMHSKVASALDTLELAQMSERLPLELSVGQQQKVAIARAIVKDPALILADEPTGEVDPITGREIIEKLIELKRKSQITLIAASHGTFMNSDADRTVFVKSGRIVTQKEAGY